MRRAFPGPGGKWQISNAGGTDPHWRADGKELYYRGLDQKLMAVEIRAGDTLEAGIPQPLFQGRVHIGNARNKFLPVEGWPALPLRRAARPRVHDADDGRPELVRGTGQVNRQLKGIP